MANLKSFIVFLIAFQVLYLTSAGSKEKRQRHYNEQCVPYDSTAQCNSSQGLICLDSGLKGYRCGCPKNNLHAQLYDTNRNACVGKAMNHCVRGSSKSNHNDSLCVVNAECNTSVYGMAICLCKAGYTENDDGTCTPSLKYGDPCVGKKDDDDTSSEPESKDQGQCDEKHGQTCSAETGKCECKFPSEQYYDTKEAKCISRAGGRCSQNGYIYSCVKNANCPASPIRLGGIGPHGIPPIALPPFLNAFASASSGAGGGEEIYVMPLRPRLPPPPPPHRHTLHHHHLPPPHHHPLAKDDPIMEFDTSFDNYDYLARSIFFGSQNNNRKGVAGNEGEESADSLDQNQPRCQCLPGFTRTSDGYCMKGYGNKCNPDDEDPIANQKNNNDSMANSRPRELCNADQFLECMDAQDGSFTCQCRNQMNERYDVEKQACVAIVGRRCRPMGNYPVCQTGAECVNGICVCANGTSMTPMETCAKDYEVECSPGECNVWKGLMCHGKSKTCLCLDSYLRYDARKRACVAGKGEMCGSVKSSSSWGNVISEMAYVECEEGTECKPREIGGKKMGSMCM